MKVTIQNKAIRYQAILSLWLLLLLVTACGADNPGLVDIPPTEEEQIKNLALGYFVRDTGIPAYEVEIEAVVDDWARVSLSPAAIDTTSDPMIMYLQNQAETDNPVPTAVPLTQPGNIAPTENDFGWAVITEPQIQFTDAELDAMGVPEKIR